MKQFIAIGVGGTLFGFGLAYSGAAIPEVVLDFLQLENLGLILILACAIAITSLSYHIFPKIMSKPIIEGKFGKKKSSFSKETFYGASLFGIGWGISGLCPGTALAGIGTGNVMLFFGVVGMFVGTLLNGYFRKS